MKVRIVKDPDYYRVETRVWYWPFWTYRTLSSDYKVAKDWADHYANPNITEVL
jgi:hypothetical protein